MFMILFIILFTQLFMNCSTRQSTMVLFMAAGCWDVLELLRFPFSGALSTGGTLKYAFVGDPSTLCPDRECNANRWNNG